MNRTRGEESPAALASWLRGCAAVAEILPSARDLTDAGTEILRAVGTCTGWDAVALWVPVASPEAAGEQMVCTAAWSAEGGALGSLESDLVGRRIGRGVDAVGRAWVERSPTGLGEVPEPSPEAAAMRERTGIRACLAVPLLYGDLVHGVLELLGRTPVRLDDAVLAAADLLGRQVGQFAAREDAVRALQRTKRELADLFENSPVGLVVAAADGTVVRINRTGLDLLVATRDTTVGRRWRDLFEDPGAADDFWRRLAGTRDKRGTLTFDARRACADGTHRWIRTSANVSWSDEGHLLHVRMFFRDVTTFKESEAALRKSEDRHRRLVDGARDYALHSLDSEGRVTSWNAGAQRLYGWQEPDILGRDFAVSFTPEDRADEVPPRMLRLAADEGEFHHEGWRVRADGSRFWAEVVYTALRDPSGALVEFSQLTRDASQRRRLEALRSKSADLALANREVVQAARRHSDLLRRILAAVDRPLEEVEAAARRLRDAAAHRDPSRHRDPSHGDASRHRDPPSVDGLPVLLAGVEDLTRAIRGLDDLASAVGDLDLQPEPVDPVRVATDTRDLLRDAAAERQVRVAIDVDPGLSEVVTDDARLRQVLFNLVSNAIKFSRERGRVDVRLLPEGDEWFRVEVEDAGIGLSDDEAAALLQPAGEEGLEHEAGLGLAATRRIVEQQGGRLGVQSTPGRGSRFFVVLPRNLVPRGEEEAPDETGPAGRGERVLVVSEDPATRASLCWTLGNSGYEVLSAVSGQEALDVSRERRCEVIALDLLMEGMGPVDFVATLRGEGASRDARSILLALGSRDAGVAATLVTDLVPRPAPADRLFAALERAHVPRGRARPLLVVDGDPAACKTVVRSLEVLNYRAVAEVDGHAALRTCAEDPPAAILLAPCLRGLDLFSFLEHLRRVRTAKDTPVVAMLPRRFEPRQLEELREAVAAAARQGTWYRQLRREVRAGVPAAVGDATSASTRDATSTGDTTSVGDDSLEDVGAADGEGPSSA